MKYLLLFFVFYMASSCCSKKGIITSNEHNQSQKTVEEKKAAPLETIKDTLANSKNIKDIKKEEPLEIANKKDDNQLFIKLHNHVLWNDLLKNHVNINGNVNYKGFNKDIHKLRKYIQELGKYTPNNDWTKYDKLAYWINAYNAMTIDLILRHYPIKSIKDIKNPWDQRFWKLGDKWYNLNEIEHQILRKMKEPRIHFAIVCASYSCPKLQNKAFTSSNLENLLTKTTKEFLGDSERNNISKNSVELSKIFQWFAKDFKQSGSLIDFLKQYTAINISAKAKKIFKDYNWDLNE